MISYRVYINRMEGPHQNGPKKNKLFGNTEEDKLTSFKKTNSCETRMGIHSSGRKARYVNLW